jgi:putative selenate reductase
MYLSGQALYPLTINLAYRLAQTFNGELPISYSGGAEALNIGEILATGIAPITVATTLLKPGGYLRLKQLAEKIDKQTEVPANGKVDIKRLERLARQALPTSAKPVFIENKSVPKTERDLPLFDCFLAPCQERCPIHQDVAAYLRQIRDGDLDAALALILAENPLPNITGQICDHQCMAACTRNYYDDPVAIREMKKVAAECGQVETAVQVAPGTSNRKVAIIGAGPAGLATAYFLAKAGLPVTVFDKNPQAGGTVRFVIPGFRLPLVAIERDVQSIAHLGVNFVFNQKSDLNLKASGEMDSTISFWQLEPASVRFYSLIARMTISSRPSNFLKIIITIKISNSARRLRLSAVAIRRWMPPVRPVEFRGLRKC